MPGDLFANSFEMFVSRRPGSDDQNLIQSFNDATSLSILAGESQTADFLTITSESSTEILSISPITTTIKGEIDDGTTLNLYASPYFDTGSYAIKVYNSSGSSVGFNIAENSGTLYTYVKNLSVDYSSDLRFTNSSAVAAISGTGYISCAWNNTRTSGYINLDSSTSFNAGYLDISGGASASGGYVKTSNGGGNIDTTGSGSIGLGVSATRTTLNGSGSAVTVTLPAITGTLMSLAGSQSVTGAKTFGASTLLQAGAGAGVLTLAYANTATSRTHTVPDGGAASTFIVAPTTSTTNTQLAMATSTAGAINFVSMSGDATISSSGVLTLGTVAISKGGTGQTTANAGFNALSPMTTLGDVVYGAASGAATRLAGNTTTTLRVLTQTGTGSASAAPVWNSVSTILPSNIAYVDVSNVFTLAQKFADGSSSAPSITFSADTNTGMYRVGTDVIGFTAGGANSATINGEGLTVFNQYGTEEHSLSFFENTLYGDYIWNVGYDATFGTWIQKMSMPLQFVGGGMFYTYSSGQICEFANIYDLGGGLGDEFYVGPFGDDAGGTTGVKVNVRYGRGNSVGSVILLDGDNQTVDATGVGFKLKRTATATNYTATSADYIIAVTSTASARTITLPAVAGTTGRVYVIKDESGGAATNNITIDGNASETIDGATTKVINTNYGTSTIYSNGSAWFTI